MYNKQFTKIEQVQYMVGWYTTHTCTCACSGDNAIKTTLHYVSGKCSPSGDRLHTEALSWVLVSYSDETQLLVIDWQAFHTLSNLLS